jgi:hypothetical protein
MRTQSARFAEEREDAAVDGVALLEVEEVAGTFDDDNVGAWTQEPSGRLGGGDADAAVAPTVEVEGRLRRDAGDRALLGGEVGGLSGRVGSPAQPSGRTPRDPSGARCP